jgi:hypothetical protein
VERAFGPAPLSHPEGGTAAAGANASSGSGENLLGSGGNRSDSSEKPPGSGRPLPAPLSPSPVEEGPRVVPPAAGRDPNQPADDPGRVRRLAELLWARVERVRERADDEARRLAELLDAYGDALGRPQSGEFPDGVQAAPASAQSAEPARAPGEPPPEPLEAEILQVFREKRSGKLRKGGNERVIRLAIYDLAVGRFGKFPDFGLLKLAHDRFDQLHHEFFQILFSQFHPADAGGG